LPSLKLRQPRAEWRKGNNLAANSRKLTLIIKLSIIERSALLRRAANFRELMLIKKIDVGRWLTNVLVSAKLRFANKVLAGQKLRNILRKR